MDPFTVAIGLAQVAPALLRFFGVGEKNVKVAEKAIDIAKIVTGKSTGAEALEELKVDPSKAFEYRMAILQNEKELEMAYLADVDSARKRDMKFIESGERNYRADAMFFLAVAVIVGTAAAIWNTPDVNEYTKGIATLILGRFLGYLDNIYNFEFGSTRSSKTKDSTIQSLSEK